MSEEKKMTTLTITQDDMEKMQRLADAIQARLAKQTGINSPLDLSAVFSAMLAQYVTAMEKELGGLDFQGTT